MSSILGFLLFPIHLQVPPKFLCSHLPSIVPWLHLLLSWGLWQCMAVLLCSPQSSLQPSHLFAVLWCTSMVGWSTFICWWIQSQDWHVCKNQSFVSSCNSSCRCMLPLVWLAPHQLFHWNHPYMCVGWVGSWFFLYNEEIVTHAEVQIQPFCLAWTVFRKRLCDNTMYRRDHIETMWSLILNVVCGILQTWSLYPHTSMYFHETWTQWPLGTVTHMASTDVGSEVI